MFQGLLALPLCDGGRGSEGTAAFPPQAGGSVQGTDGWVNYGGVGGSGPWGSGGGDGFADAACGFGTIRPVSARAAGAR